MEDLTKLRFKDAPWMEYFQNPDKFQTRNIIVGGAGGTGSWVSLFLARIGFDIILYDFDTVEEVNLAGQFFKQADVGRAKANAVSENTSMFAKKYISTRGKFTEGSYSMPIMISCFDSMEARKIFFKRWLEGKEYNKNGILIDLRLLAEQMQIFCVKFNNKEEHTEYAKYLYEENEVHEGVCSFKQTTHAAAIIAGQATAFLTNHIANVMTGTEDRMIPFKWEYFIPLQTYDEIYLNKTT